jgi:hypothetical protein
MQARLSRENCSIKAPRADKGAAQMQGFPSAMIKKRKMCKIKNYSLRKCADQGFIRYKKWRTVDKAVSWVYNIDIKDLHRTEVGYVSQTKN